MQTRFHPRFNDLPDRQEADVVLRNCVHCGFCNAACPTYQLLGDERDGPRGRIYLIKQLLETGSASEKTRIHLDRCLTCGSCETSCPSGVKYTRLLDIGRGIIEQQAPRRFLDGLLRWSLRRIVPYPKRVMALFKLARFCRPLLPTMLKAKVPPQQAAATWPATRHRRTILLLPGCVQAAVTPNTNSAAARVLDKLGVRLKVATRTTCCGALSYHLAKQGEGLEYMRRNIDAWWPEIEAGAEAIISSASGCALMIKEYGVALQHDPAYAEKARNVSALARDISEVIAQEDLSLLKLKPRQVTTAFHCPCTLQHGQQLPGVVEKILAKAGIALVATADPHLCCGSAGTYSILQPQLSQRLLENKLEALTINQPAQIVTANIGCQLHLQSKAKVPVKHWIELLDQSSQ